MGGKVITYTVILVLLSITVSSLQISELFPNPVGKDNAPMPEGEYVELYNDEHQTVELLGYKLKDKTNKTIIIGK